MARSRSLRPAPARTSRRPDLESLESRQLLSTVAEAVALDALSVVPAEARYGGPSNGFDPVIGASAARKEFQVDGSGLAVAVIDGGVSYNHPALGGGYGPGKKVVGGYDFAGKDADPIATNLQHGTSVAGLIASADPAYPGVAPGAEIVALRVFDDANKSDFRYVADALQWVVDNHDAYGISVVNVSLSDGRNYTRNWYAGDGDVGQRITGLVDKLTAMNIPVVTATGNSFAGQEGSGFTGIIASSISVTATDGAETFMATAQRLGPVAGGESATDLAAPGVGLTAPNGSSGSLSVSGTSYAAPLVSGAIVLLQQVYQHRFNTLPSVSDIEGWLKKGSAPVTDPATGITIGRLDIPKSLGLVPLPAAQVLTPPPAVVTPPPVVPVVMDPTPPPPPTPVPAPAEPTSPVVAPEPAPGFRVWLNGQILTGASVEETAAATGVPSSFLNRVVRSLRDWWASPRSKVRVWTAAGAPAAATPAGVESAPAESATTAPAARPWQTFVSGRRSR